MKKALSLVLALVLCMSLVACGGDSSENKAIVGEWKSIGGGDSIVFNEDGTGTWGKDSFEWSYSKADEKYSMVAMGMTVTFEIKTENGIRSLTPLGMLSPWIYYHIDDYEKANNPQQDTTGSNDNNADYEGENVTRHDGYIVTKSGEIILSEEKFLEFLQVIEITPENWKDYCKFEAVVYENKNGFGEVTDSSIQYELSIKDLGDFTYTWYNPLNENRIDSCSIDLMNHATGERWTYDILPGDPLWYGHTECTIDDLELLRFAGKLVLLMIPEEFQNTDESEIRYIRVGEEGDNEIFYDCEAPYRGAFFKITGSFLAGE